MTFDFPDPFGPISTFSGPSSIGGESGPKDNRFRNCSVWINLVSPALQSLTPCQIHANHALTFYHNRSPPHLPGDCPSPAVSSSIIRRMSTIRKDRKQHEILEGINQNSSYS